MILSREKAYLIVALVALLAALGGWACSDGNSASSDPTRPPSQTPEMRDDTSAAATRAAKATNSAADGVEWPPGRGTTTPEIRYGVPPVVTSVVEVTITAEDLCRMMREELAALQEDVDRARLQAGDEAAQWLKDKREKEIREMYVARIAALRGLEPGTDIAVLCPP